MCKKRQCAAAEKIEKLKAWAKGLHNAARRIIFAVSKKETQIFYIMKNYQENEFKVRAYGRTELAHIYSPTIKPESAYRRLLKWISISPELSKQLLKDGKPLKYRTFTPYEVRLIVEHLGEP